MEAQSPAHAIQLLRNGGEAFPRWIEAIEQAQEEVLLEMYWIDDSEAVGRRFANLLAKRAREGLDVFVLYDAIGTLGTDPELFRTMTDAGVCVIEFHPIGPWQHRFRLDRVQRRDHRKILVVDGRIGFTGGINLCLEELPHEQGGHGWRDDAVEITGPAVLELRRLFYDNWFSLEGSAPKRGSSIQQRARREQARAARSQTGEQTEPSPWSVRFQRHSNSPPGRPGPTKELATKPDATVSAMPVVQVLGHKGWAAQRSIRRMYLRQLREAKQRILLANSYFVPDTAVLRALERAVQRNVEVRVLIPRESDVPTVAWASRALYARLLKHGIHVHEWPKGMLHSKTALVDQWATVGSYNLDYRSWRYNLEVNVGSEDPAFVAAVEASLREDFARSEELTLEVWERRPWFHRVIEWAHYLVRKVL